MERVGGHNYNHGHGGAMVGYSAFSESYATKSEQHVEYGGLVGKPNKDVVGKVHQFLQPAWNSSSHDRPKKTEPYHGARPGSAWNNVHVDNSPPSKNQIGKYNDYSSDESDDDDYDRDDYYQRPKHFEDYDDRHDYAPHGYPPQEKPNSYKAKPIGKDYTTPPPQSYYETPNPNENSYTNTTHPPQSYYNAPKPNGNAYITPLPQPYYGTSKPKGNDYTTPPPQQYYEGVPNNKPIGYKPLPQVKTKLDGPHKGPIESHIENMRINSPRSAGSQRSPFTPSPKSSNTSSPRSPYHSSPRKDHDYREAIDSGEARRWYGGATVGGPLEHYKGTINSEEAAKRYGGIYFRN